MTRRGTNAWRGVGALPLHRRRLAVGPRGRSRPRRAARSCSLRRRELGRVREYGADGGGPILRDRRLDLGRRQPHRDRPRSRPPPLLFDQGAGDREAENARAQARRRASARRTACRLFVYRNDSDDRRASARADPLAPETPRSTSTLPTEICKLEDSQVLGPTLYVQGHLSRVDGELRPRAARRRRRSRGSTPPASSATASSRPRATRDREQARIEVSGFFGDDDESHEMKARRRASPRRGDDAVALGSGRLGVPRDR